MIYILLAFISLLQLSPPHSKFPISALSPGLPLGGFGLGNGTSLGAGPLRLPGQMAAQACVLLVSNLNEEVTIPRPIDLSS